MNKSKRFTYSCARKPEGKSTRLNRLLCFALLVGVALALAVIAVWSLAIERERNHIRSANSVTSRISEALIRDDLDKRAAALQRLARRWDAAGGMPGDLWKADAQRLRADMPDFQTIEWVDADLHSRWTSSPQGNEATQDLVLSQYKPAQFSRASARQGSTPQWSSPFELPQQGVAMLEWVSVTRDGRFDGVILGVLLLQPWLATVSERTHNSDQLLRVFVQGQEVYGQSKRVDEQWTERRDFQAHGLSWTTLVTPTDDFVATFQSRKATFFLCIGLLLSVLVAAVVLLVKTASIPARQFRDRSSQRLLERDACRTQQQMAQADRLNTLGEMASGIAHEINQPLTAISLFAQAGKRLLDGANYAQMPLIFDKLSEHVQRTGAIIEQMQTMTRCHASTREVVDCNTLVAVVARLAAVEARICNIRIRLLLATELLPVYIDSVQIQQVALNLLRNGMEAMRLVECQYGDTISIRTRRRNDGNIEVAIIDTGCGVSAAAADNLFAPFSTTKEIGTGLGLSIGQAIIGAHGGQIHCRNNAAAGVTFFFTLPAVTPGDQDE